ncbi:Uncharacterised protein [Achromobacter sp. 2789STDY5608633]|uniref:Uncharacterized protein n=1 Tax=Achromobacter insuavis TaxID=1287735 RepID=A0A6J5A1J2_9BURK|nr:hypothetical protein LMG26845_00496 [Achromobacter insuavis]CUJ60844.1 Uncharacterised protein [Achromobacter sp. 2789STDY5608628]CUJ66648.1 Uncharacterised protein [Achromobacter sp. 2789STDY5608633]
MSVALFILCGLCAAYPLGLIGDFAMAFLRKSA